MNQLFGSNQKNRPATLKSQILFVNSMKWKKLQKTHKSVGSVTAFRLRSWYILQDNTNQAAGELDNNLHINVQEYNSVQSKQQQYN